MTAFFNPKGVCLNLSCTKNRRFLGMFDVSCTRFARFLCMSYQSCIRKRLFLCTLFKLLMFNWLGKL